MSNTLASAQSQLSLPMILYLTIGLLAATAVALAAGVFRKHALHTPDRIALDEPPSTVFLIFMAGLTVWLLAPAFYVVFAYAPATTKGQIDLSQNEEAVLGAVSGLGGLVALLLGSLFYRKNAFARLGLGLRHLGQAVPRSLAAMIFVMPLMTWVSLLAVWLWQTLHWEHPLKHDLLQVLDQTSDFRLVALVIFTAAVIAPVFEELLFRGYLQTLLRHFFRRPWPAILLASLAFTAVHPWWSMPPIFFLSLCLGYAYERNGNLFLPILIHALFNALSILASQYVSP